MSTASKNIFVIAFLAIILCLTSLLHSHSIVFIHIGKNLPIHINVSISQARLFNDCPIFLIANEEAIKNASSQLKNEQVTFISCESLSPSVSHIRFRNYPVQDWTCNGLWRLSSERFYYLEELIRQYDLSDVFHLESDVMLYTNLDDLLPVFKKHYKEMIGAIFENDNRCVASFMYVPNIYPISKLIEFYPLNIHGSQTDMEVLAQFKNKYHKILIDHLPIVISEYSHDHPIGELSIKSKQPECYFNHVDEFKSIFDGAALGIYLAGWDEHYHSVEKRFGTITPHSVFNPSFFKIDWKLDDRGRKIPFIIYKGKQVPINNLHITNKIIIQNFHSL